MPDEKPGWTYIPITVCDGPVTTYVMCAGCNRLVNIGTHVQDSDECRAQWGDPKLLQG